MHDLIELKVLSYLAGLSEITEEDKREIDGYTRIVLEHLLGYTIPYDVNLVLDMLEEAHSSEEHFTQTRKKYVDLIRRQLNQAGLTEITGTATELINVQRSLTDIHKGYVEVFNIAKNRLDQERKADEEQTLILVSPGSFIEESIANFSTVGECESLLSIWKEELKKEASIVSQLTKVFGDQIKDIKTARAWFEFVINDSEMIKSYKDYVRTYSTFLVPNENDHPDQTVKPMEKLLAASSTDDLYQLHQYIYTQQRMSKNAGTPIHNPMDNFLSFVASIDRTVTNRHLKSIIRQFEVPKRESTGSESSPPSTHDNELEELAALSALSYLSQENCLHLLLISSHERAVFDKKSVNKERIHELVTILSYSITTLREKLHQAITKLASRITDEHEQRRVLGRTRKLFEQSPGDGESIFTKISQTRSIKLAQSMKKFEDSTDKFKEHSEKDNVYTRSDVNYVGACCLAMQLFKTKILSTPITGHDQILRDTWNAFQSLDEKYRISTRRPLCRAQIFVTTGTPILIKEFSSALADVMNTNMLVLREVLKARQDRLDMFRSCASEVVCREIMTRDYHEESHEIRKLRQQLACIAKEKDTIEAKLRSTIHSQQEQIGKQSSMIEALTNELKALYQGANKQVDDVKTDRPPLANTTNVPKGAI